MTSIEQLYHEHHQQDRRTCPSIGVCRAQAISIADWHDRPMCLDACGAIEPTSPGSYPLQPDGMPAEPRGKVGEALTIEQESSGTASRLGDAWRSSAELSEFAA